MMETNTIICFTDWWLKLERIGDILLLIETNTDMILMAVNDWWWKPILFDFNWLMIEI